jgi:signal transduction histidine kinase
VRRALILAIVGIVLGALLLAGAGTFLVANAGARSDSARELAEQARRVAVEVPAILAAPTAKLRVDLVRVVKATVGADFVTLVTGGEPGISHHVASVVGGRLPAAVTLARLQPRRLLAGAVVSGSSGNTVFAAVALAGVAPAQLRHPGVSPRSAASAAGTGTVVLVLTRTFHGAGLGGGYLVLVSGGTLVVAAGVALVLSGRITRPLRQAVDVTGRIAAGDLSVRVPDDPSHYPELASLVDSINTMTSALARSQGQERQFLLSVSHDLRTPLTSILGYAEAIADGATEDPATAAVVIATEARRLARLVQDLLDLARLDAHQFSLHLDRIDVVPLLHGAADSIRPTAAGAGLRVTVTVGDEGPIWVVADPDRTRQLLANLLDNACRFAETQVTLDARRCSEGGVELRVVDDGPGIAPEHLPRIFERHFQISTGKHRPAGSGLGLAIVAELAAAMGGRVRASSPAGPGSTGPGSTGPGSTRPGAIFDVWLPDHPDHLVPANR